MIAAVASGVWLHPLYRVPQHAHTRWLSPSHSSMGGRNVSTEHSLSAACRYMYMCICMYTCILYMCMHLHVHVHVLGVYSLYKCRDMHEYVCMCSCFALCILHVHVCGALLV